MSADGEISGHVNIGLIASITEGVLSETLIEFSAKYPNVGVRVADGYSATLTDWVAGGQIDAAIINKPRRQLSLNVEHIVDEEMVLITSAGYSAPLPASYMCARFHRSNWGWCCRPGNTVCAAFSTASRSTRMWISRRSSK